jgi:pimeloyl-ACP methyl ester carboxylesterase
MPRECLVLPPVGRYGRLPLPSDALEAQIVAGTWKPPKAGDTVTMQDGPRTWETAKLDDKGVVAHRALGGGYAYFAVTSDAAKVVVLEASGHAMVYVNGEPRVGDIYQNNLVKLPILLKKGINDLLFQCVRGQLHAKVIAPAKSAIFNTSDATLPSLRVGDETPQWGALPVINATTQPQDQLAIEANLLDGAPVRTKLPVLPPISTRKVAFQFAGRPPKPEADCPLELKLLRKNGEAWETLDTAKFTLGVRKPEQKHKRTFISAIDGSVQYFSVVPPLPANGGGPSKDKPALVMTLHGAAVEGDGQAACFSQKNNIYVVAPTNRRPYGFDWEDWGRLDAMEVLDLAEKTFGTDPRRTYLTGHSMGGHGTWHIGATYPGRFAAIGPSAGWISMWSYAGMKKAADPKPLQELILRAAMPSDTLALAPNFASYGIYVLHGDKDDNVPVEQAREMKKVLEGFHKDFAYHEQPGAGHWWGSPCVDWQPMFDFFAKHVQPETKDIRQVDFITASPGVSAEMHWASIEAQIHPMKPSSIHIHWDPEKRSYKGTTDNVARLALEIGYAATEGPVNVELDGQKMANLSWPVPIPVLFFQRAGDKWSEINLPSRALKSPRRSGPFRDAFRHRMIFVYGTHGKPEENAWAFAKARYDAETFWYRGNGSIDIVADSGFDANAERNRNVILYGNAATNSAWKALLADSPVQVEAGKIRVGEREETGDNLACLFLRPRAGSETACVAAVSGSGLAGMRLTDRLPYFVSGVGYPDCLVFDTDTLIKEGDGVRVAGYFGVDWGVKNGEFAWRQ